jgi:hypothetical protein
MQSCEEAEWFLENCPGMRMDGDGDGVPCEQQFCQKDLSFDLSQYLERSIFPVHKGFDLVIHR